MDNNVSKVDTSNKDLVLFFITIVIGIPLVTYLVITIGNYFHPCASSDSRGSNCAQAFKCELNKDKTKTCTYCVDYDCSETGKVICPADVSE